MDDPVALEIHADNLQLRELLQAVAGDLEHLAASYPEVAGVLLGRSQRIRARLHAGPDHARSGVSG